MPPASTLGQGELLRTVLPPASTLRQGELGGDLSEGSRERGRDPSEVLQAEQGPECGLC